MGPTLQDVRGVPIPGVRGVAPHRPPAAVPFRDVLGQLLGQRPVRGPQPHAAAPLRPPARVDRVRQPADVGPAAKPEPHARAHPGAASAGRAPIAGPAKRALATAIRHAAGAAGLDPALSVAVARAESNLDPGARSSDGLSVGTFQVTRSTAAEMRRKIATGAVARPPGADDIALGVGYLRYLHDLFGRGARLGAGLQAVAVPDARERRLFAVAAYNAGEGRVAQAQARAALVGRDPRRFTNVQRFLPAITQDYVQRVVGYAREGSLA